MLWATLARAVLAARSTDGSCISTTASWRRRCSGVSSPLILVARLDLPADWASAGAAPPGGLRLRLRVPHPGGRRHAIRSVTVGGERWSAFNATASTVGRI